MTNEPRTYDEIDEIEEQDAYADWLEYYDNGPAHIAISDHSVAVGTRP